ncbi:hypothetical protein [Clavibacter michiganensis]|uniref:hypothetical protein n=1 Tax=Clavibacter michiganensis TaxID=28447 RepID=UPI002931B36B|nr:hypothetical protein [Clavibacter michiganensis]
MLTPDETAGTVYPTRRERREAERRAAEAQQAPEAQEAPLDDSVAQPAAEPAQVAPAPRALHIPVEAPEAPRAHLSLIPI